MTRLLLALFLLLPVALQAAGLGVYNPAQHAVNGFMPTQLPGLVAWYDAQSAVYTNGTSINALLDRSQNLKHATNSSSSQQPAYRTNAFNGRHSVRFDGVDDWLHSNGNVVPTNGIGSAFIAVVPRAITSVVHSIIGQYAVGGSGRMLWAMNQNSSGTAIASNFNMFFNGSSSGDGEFGFPNHFTNSSIGLIAGYNSSGESESAKIYHNGRLHDSFTVSHVYSTNLTIGNAYGLSLYANFDLLEMVFTSTSLSGYQVLQIQRYLGTKYGIVVQ